MKIFERDYLALNLLNASLYIIPISFLIGNFAINLNVFLIIIFGLTKYRSKIFQIQKNDLLSIFLLIFFLFIIFTSIFNYFESSHGHNIIKSFLFLRYFLLYLVLGHMVEKKELNFKIFFSSCALISLFLSTDIVLQFSTGKDLLNFQTIGGVYNSGFFGTELVAGGFLIRFLFLGLFCFVFLNNFKQKIEPLVFCSIFIIGFIGMVLSGNRMPVFMFLPFVFLSLFFLTEFRKKIFISFLLCLIFFSVLLKINDQYYNKYSSFIGNAQNIIVKFPIYIKKNLFVQKNLNKNVLDIEKSIKKKEERINIGSGHLAVFLTAFDVWKSNTKIGGGIKSFRINCFKFSKGDPSKYQTNRYCDAHPHNYYLEILTDTGIIGLLLFLIILYQMLIKGIFKANKMYSKDKIIFISLMICLIVELFPLRSTGSIFSTNNASYIFILIGLISKLNIAGKNIKN